jgi:Na+-driven multidrug efflux pump
MAAPLVISFWMRSAFTFVDTAYAATIGDAAIAAIGLTAPFEFLMIAVWVGLSTGLTSGLARAMGSREGRKIDQYLRATWKLVVGASIAFALLGAGIWIWAPDLDLAPDVRGSFRIFGSVLIAGSALTTFWSVIPDSLVKAHHDTRATMWAGIWSNLINVALNTLFLFVFHWGVFGIAFSTVIGRLGGLAYALVQARRHETRRIASGIDDEPGLDPAPYKTLLRLTVPSSLTFGLTAAETALVNYLLATLDRATEAIAAYSIYYRVSMFAVTPMIAAGVAMLPYAARRLGEGDVEGVRRGLRQALEASALYSIAFVAPLMLVLAPQLARWLAEAETTRQYTEWALRLIPLACLIGSPFMLCRPVFEAMNRGGPGLAIAVFRYLVLTIPFAWIGLQVSRSLDRPPLYGLMIGLLAAAAIASGVFYLWLRRSLPKRGTAASRQAQPLTVDSAAVADPMPQGPPSGVDPTS